MFNTSSKEFVFWQKYKKGKLFPSNHFCREQPHGSSVLTHWDFGNMLLVCGDKLWYTCHDTFVLYWTKKNKFKFCENDACWWGQVMMHRKIRTHIWQWIVGDRMLADDIWQPGTQIQIQIQIQIHQRRSQPQSIWPKCYWNSVSCLIYTI